MGICKSCLDFEQKSSNNEINRDYPQNFDREESLIKCTYEIKVYN